MLHFECEVVAKQTSHHLVNAFQCDSILGKYIFFASHSIKLTISIGLKRVWTHLALKEIQRSFHFRIQMYSIFRRNIRSLAIKSIGIRFSADPMRCCRKAEFQTSRECETIPFNLMFIAKFAGKVFFTVFPFLS